MSQNTRTYQRGGVLTLFNRQEKGGLASVKTSRTRNSGASKFAIRGTLQDPRTRGGTQTERKNISTNANKDMTD